MTADWQQRNPSRASKTDAPGELDYDVILAEVKKAVHGVSLATAKSGPFTVGDALLISHYMQPPESKDAAQNQDRDYPQLDIIQHLQANIEARVEKLALFMTQTIGIDNSRAQLREQEGLKRDLNAFAAKLRDLTTTTSPDGESTVTAPYDIINAKKFEAAQTLPEASEEISDVIERTLAHVQMKSIPVAAR